MPGVTGVLNKDMNIHNCSAFYQIKFDEHKSVPFCRVSEKDKLLRIITFASFIEIKH